MKFMLKILVPCVLKISLLATLFYGGVFAYDYFVVTHPDESPQSNHKQTHRHKIA